MDRWWILDEDNKQDCICLLYTSIAARMQLVEGNSIDELKSRVDDIDLSYLDPMFPGRQKSGLINKDVYKRQGMYGCVEMLLD